MSTRPESRRRIGRQCLPDAFDIRRFISTPPRAKPSGQRTAASLIPDTFDHASHWPQDSLISPVAGCLGNARQPPEERFSPGLSLGAIFPRILVSAVG